MGLLTEGSPLSWEETKELADHVRKHGIIQFINMYHRLKGRQGDILKWGDEVSFDLSSSVCLKNNLAVKAFISYVRHGLQIYH